MAPLLTRLAASTPASEVALAPVIAEVDAVALLETSAKRCALFSASSSTSPSAEKVLSLMKAVVVDGFSTPIGVPSRASMAWKRMFCSFQPTVLKAASTLATSPAEVVACLVTASRVEVFCASSTMEPVPSSTQLASLL